MLSSPRRGMFWMLALLGLLISPAFLRRGIAGDTMYFSLQALAPLPAAPSSLLVQSPTFINVPAGAMLSVHLLRGENLIATSTLRFAEAYANQALLPPVPIASFVPPGDPAVPGQPLPGATLAPGQADLAALAAAPGEHRLLWTLSEGVIGTPGRAVVTGAQVGFVNLKLALVSPAARPAEPKPGSVLFFHRYSSNPTNTAREDTTLSLTNTHPAESAKVRLFLVSAASCQPVEFSVCLTPRQTLNALMSDIDPGIKGYVIAIACDAAGQPAQFNWLIGHTQVKQPSPMTGLPFDAALSALTVAKRAPGTVTASGGAAEMVFDDVMYDRLPGQIAADNVPSQSGGLNATTLAVYRPLANLAGGAATDTVQLSAYSDTGAASSAAVSLTCYRDLSVASLRLNPITLSNLLPAGVTAWLALSGNEALPLLGAQLNAGRFTGGAAARALAFSAEYRIRVPVNTPVCPVTTQAPAGHVQ
jgi:hypothetical protein